MEITNLSLVFEHSDEHIYYQIQDHQSEKPCELIMIDGHRRLKKTGRF